MPKLIFRKKDAFLWIGGLLASTGSVLLKLLGHPLYIGLPVFVAGVLLLLYGGLGLVPKPVIILDNWDPQLLYQAFRDADPNATIRILQTSIPDFTALLGILEDLLTRQNKQFRFRVLLLDYEKALNVLEARMRYRVEKAAAHAAEIQTQVEQFIAFKQRVDAAWLEPRTGAQLSLEIRLYSFLPFGSVFEIGAEKVFSGIFWNWTSSVNGPMIVVADHKSKTWSCFSKQLDFGWQDARSIFPQASTVTAQAGSAEVKKPEPGGH